MKKYELIETTAKMLSKTPKIYLPKEYDESTPSIFICNHEKNFGPISFALHFPYKARPWSHSEVVHYDEGLDYVSKYCFQQRLKLNVRLSNYFAKKILRPLNYVINMNNPIPIYHDGVRDRNTINESISSLVKGESQVIFGTNHNPLMQGNKLNPNFDFLKGYLLVIKQASKLGMNPNIYPVSFNKKKNTISIGELTKLNTQEQWRTEKKRINDHLVNEVIFGYLHPDRKAETNIKAQDYYKYNFESLYN